MDKSSSLGMPMHYPKKYPRSTSIKLGDAPEAPLLHRQKSGHLLKYYIFIASCTICFSWSVSYFSFLSWLVLFAAINGWTPTNFLWRRCTHFYLPRILRFSFLQFHRVFFFFCYCFWFSFSP
jgi:hypothetical protein